ncbi:hypothetical protein AYI70_g266, partial [Smittium culicis]
MDGIQSKDVKMRRVFIAEFSRFNKEMRINCFDRVFDILIEMLGSDYLKTKELEDKNFSKPLYLALQASIVSSFSSFIHISSHISDEKAIQLFETIEPLAVNGVWNVKTSAIRLALLMLNNLFVQRLENAVVIRSETFYDVVFTKTSNILDSSFSDLGSPSNRLLSLKIAQFVLNNFVQESAFSSMRNSLNELRNSLVKKSKNILNQGSEDSDLAIKSESSRILMSLNK